jgi:hypothetical protein
MRRQCVRDEQRLRWCACAWCRACARRVLIGAGRAGRLVIYYRGFDGAMYSTQQISPSNHQYTPPQRMCQFDDESCLVV